MQDPQNALIEMTCTNNTNRDQPLIFRGTLQTPLKCKKMNVVRFNIPNNNVPIMVNFKPNKYQFSLRFDGVTVSRYVSLDVRNTVNEKNVRDIDTLVTSLNVALSMLVSQLNAQKALPTLDIPYIYYNKTNGLFNIVALSQHYNSAGALPIEILMNTALYNILDTIPVYDTGAEDTGRYKILFRVSYENTYRTNYLKLEQESCTLSNYASPRALQIVSDGIPSQLMINVKNVYGVDTSNTISYNQSSLPVIQNYSFNYNGGTMSLKTTNDYYITTNRFREIETPINGVSYLQFSVSYICNDDSVYPMLISPYSRSNIVLQFSDIY
jgi:hypothetical protein